jgi:Flp pilus assembly protein TadG
MKCKFMLSRSSQAVDRHPASRSPLCRTCLEIDGLYRRRARTKANRPRWRRGAAVTEFAIVAPVFFLMIVGFLEFGRALMVQQVLINASRVGARQASTTAATLAEVEAAVEEYTSGVAVPAVDVSVTPDPSAATPGTTITVTTSVAFGDVSWMTSPWFLGGKTLTATSQMRKEGFE